MEILDQNAMEDLSKKLRICSITFWNHCIPDSFEPCTWEFRPCHPIRCLDLYCNWQFYHPCTWLFTCGTRLFQSLTNVLKECSAEFIRVCPGLDRIPCDFGPVIDASKFKEQEQQSRIAALEAKVKELELKKG